jgi:hypothetical protein
MMGKEGIQYIFDPHSISRAKVIVAMCCDRRFLVIVSLMLVCLWFSRLHVALWLHSEVHMRDGTIYGALRLDIQDPEQQYCTIAPCMKGSIVVFG